MSAFTANLLDTLAAVRAALVKVGVEHCFIGALSAMAWGRPRATSDLDVVIAVSPERFSAVDAEFRVRGLNPGRAVGPAEPTDALPDIAVYWTVAQPSVRVDVFIAKVDFERAVLVTAGVTDVEGQAVRVAGPEASIIYKLLANRGKDTVDVEWIFENRELGRHRLDWAFLDRWAAEWEIADRLAPYRAKYGPATGLAIG